jgi:glycogen operon protein
MELRMRQRKNAYAMMLFAQGTPMLLAGDEFGNSQNGNNNPYCHDSELTWLDWSKTRGNKELTTFVQEAVAFRKAHKMLHQSRKLQCADQLSSGFPDLSFHGERAWYGDFERTRRYLGCMYSGFYAGEENFLYIAYNFNWDPQEFALPLLPKGKEWYGVMDTSKKQSFVPEAEQEGLNGARSFEVPARTIVVLEGK